MSDLNKWLEEKINNYVFFLPIPYLPGSNPQWRTVSSVKWEIYFEAGYQHILCLSVWHIQAKDRSTSDRTELQVVFKLDFFRAQPNNFNFVK